MSCAAQQPIEPPAPLRFASSQSKAVGLGSSSLDGFLKSHAPQVVGTLHLAANSSIFLSGNPYAMAGAALSMAGKVIMIAYGHKHTKEEMEAPGHCHARPGLIGAIDKVTHPKDYPIEAACGMSALSSLMMMGYGLTGGGLTPLLSEALSLALNMFVINGAEKKPGLENAPCDSLLFAHSKSGALAWCGKEVQMLKDNPVFTSSMINTLLNVGVTIGALIEENPNMAIAGALLTVSTLTQALYIRKNDYNVEPDEAPASAAKETSAGYFVQKEIARRQMPAPQVTRAA